MGAMGINESWSSVQQYMYLPLFRPETAGRWLTKDEKAVAVMRSESSGNTDDKPFDKHQFFAALIDYKNWLAGSVYGNFRLFRMM